MHSNDFIIKKSFEKHFKVCQQFAASVVLVEMIQVQNILDAILLSK